MSISNNTLSRAELTNNIEEVRNIHYGDILIKYSAVLDIANDNVPYIKGAKIAQYSKHLLQDGDIVVADTAEDETAGKVVEIGDIQGFPIVAGLHTIVCRPVQRFASKYLGYYMNSGTFHQQLLPLMQGTKVTSINRGSLLEIEMKYPVLKDEQQKIGDFFKTLDNLITLHQRKLTHLQAKKKSLLQKMFPKKGERVPEIRFPGFTDAWEQRKLGDMTSVLSASRVHREEWRNSGVPFYRSSDVVSAYKGMENERVYISYELFEKLSSVSGKPQKGDIFITGGGSIGIPYIVPDNNPLYSKDADLIWVKRTDQIDPYCLYTYFLSPTFRTYLTGISHIGTIAHYTIEQVKNTAPLLPIVIEQKKIGDFFKSLDNLITLHQRKLTHLQTQKKALLQQMFV